MTVMDTTQVGRVMRLAELPPHEAFAVFAKLYEEMLLDAQRLSEQLQDFERLESGLALSLGKAREAEAGSKFFLDDDPEAQAYLAELVDRVKGGDDV